MGDIIKKVRKGEPLVIPASAYNSFADLVNKNAGQPSSPSIDRPLQQGEIQGFYTGGLILRRFHMVSYDTVNTSVTPQDNLEAFHNRFILNFKLVTSVAGVPFLILSENAKPNTITRAIASGVTPVEIEVKDEDHAFAKVQTGVNASLRSVVLESADTGNAVILWKESGLGRKWAVVNITPGSSGGGTNSVIPVTLTFLSGTAGSAFFRASYRYRVREIDGTLLLADVNPTSAPHQWVRSIGKMAKADFGLAYLNNAGNWALAWINEVYQHAPCET